MEQKAYHIMLENAAQYVLLPGDPGRCEAIAAAFDGPRLVARNREFTTYAGALSGVPVLVTSTGIGGPSAAIAIEELAALGAHTFIRVGTCGGIDTRVCAGDCVIAAAAVRQEGTSRAYAPVEYPAAADYGVLEALCAAARAKGVSWHAGVVQSKDSFYGQHDPSRMPVATQLLEQWEAWKRLGVLASEMETAALFCAAAALRVRCGAVFHVLWNQERQAAGLPDAPDYDTGPAVAVAVGALRRLIERDRAAGREA